MFVYQLVERISAICVAVVDRPFKVVHSKRDVFVLVSGNDTPGALLLLLLLG